LLILVIGGRFGGQYIADTKKSIVNAEYAAARQEKIPVFTFVKRNVYSDHFVFSKNKNNDSLDKIVFPSIENNKHADRIFRFIDEVRTADVNNGVFAFDFAREISELLRKQWAGMFFEFMQQRNADEQLRANRNLLDNISTASDKVEELVKRLYRHLDGAGADAIIEDVETRSKARRFYESLPATTRGRATPFDPDVDPNACQDWLDYFATATGGNVDRAFPEGNIVITWGGIGRMIVSDKESKRFSTNQQELFQLVQKLTAELRAEVIADWRSESDK